MPQESQSENSPTVTNSEVVEQTPITENVETVNEKRPFYKTFRFYLYLIFILLIVVLVLWLINVFNVYKQASIYKKTYDVVQNEKAFCEGIQGTSQPEDIFDYCDRFESKFNNLETIK